MYRPRKRRSFIRARASDRPSGLFRILRNAFEAGAESLSASSILQETISDLSLSEKTACRSWAVSKAVMARAALLRHPSSEERNSVLPAREKGPSFCVLWNHLRDGFPKTAVTTPS